jgi:hypothetical protein
MEVCWWVMRIEGVLAGDGHRAILVRGTGGSEWMKTMELSNESRFISEWKLVRRVVGGAVREGMEKEQSWPIS